MDESEFPIGSKFEITEDDNIISTLECGHCGSLNDLFKVDLGFAIRYLCFKCRELIADWI